MRRPTLALTALAGPDERGLLQRQAVGRTRSPTCPIMLASEEKHPAPRPGGAAPGRTGDLDNISVVHRGARARRRRAPADLLMKDNMQAFFTAGVDGYFEDQFVEAINRACRWIVR